MDGNLQPAFIGFVLVSTGAVSGVIVADAAGQIDPAIAGPIAALLFAVAVAVGTLSAALVRWMDRKAIADIPAKIAPIVAAAVVPAIAEKVAEKVAEKIIVVVSPPTVTPG